ncbi:MAG: hypothetical protein ACO1OT_10525 [Heyndrickxia sp.]
MNYKPFGTIITIIGLIMIIFSFRWGLIITNHSNYKSDPYFISGQTIHSLQFIVIGSLLSWVGLKILLNEFLKK